MSLQYSIYEAKARFSEVIRRVREGRAVIVLYRGQPVAEIRSIERQRNQTLGERLRDLERRGILIPASLPRQSFRPVARRPGALANFLAERGE